MSSPFFWVLVPKWALRFDKVPSMLMDINRKGATTSGNCYTVHGKAESDKSVVTQNKRRDTSCHCLFVKIPKYYTLYHLIKVFWCLQKVNAQKSPKPLPTTAALHSSLDTPPSAFLPKTDGNAEPRWASIKNISAIYYFIHSSGTQCSVLQALDMQNLLNVLSGTSGKLSLSLWLFAPLVLHLYSIFFQ